MPEITYKALTAFAQKITIQAWIYKLCQDMTCYLNTSPELRIQLAAYACRDEAHNMTVCGQFGEAHLSAAV